MFNIINPTATRPETAGSIASVPTSSAQTSSSLFISAPSSNAGSSSNSSSGSFSAMA